MKTITFEGKKYEVKDNMNHVAKCQTGTIFSFSLRPECNYTMGWGFDGFKGECQCLGNAGSGKNWQESLIEV